MHLVDFITKKFVTMHGHMNVKFVIQQVHSAMSCGLLWISIMH